MLTLTFAANAEIQRPTGTIAKNSEINTIIAPTIRMKAIPSIIKLSFHIFVVMLNIVTSYNSTGVQQPSIDPILKY